MSIPEPWLAQPDTNITAAVHRTVHAVGALIQALGEGTHTLHAVSESTDAPYVQAEADLCIGIRPANLAILDRRAFDALFALLVFALEGSTRGTVLIATSAAAPRPRACGWTLRDRWLHPMDTAELRQAVTPCPGNTTAVERDAYQAPALQAPDTDADEEYRHG
ncbi:hypothetical protein [Streptomyces sp. NPDC093094]|uniref:hypothetical protein n=1 Tax=Streptomyces sp. NPDC093094 TaxID=3366026 RepID=UPI00381EB093